MNFENERFDFDGSKVLFETKIKDFVDSNNNCFEGNSFFKIIILKDLSLVAKVRLAHCKTEVFRLNNIKDCCVVLLDMLGYKEHYKTGLPSIC